MNLGWVEIFLGIIKQRKAPISALPKETLKQGKVP